LAYLAEVEGQRPGHTHRISSQRVSIGRDPRSQIQLHDRSVGRQQAVILQQGDQFFLHDMAASNPTLLNGQQVVGRTLLHDRDMIELGTTKLQFIMLDKNGI
ncbi:MAG: FHA domain-containing protein, partial [Ardenticatenaceae bacterium]